VSKKIKFKDGELLQNLAGEGGPALHRNGGTGEKARQSYRRLKEAILTGVNPERGFGEEFYLGSSPEGGEVLGGAPPQKQGGKKHNACSGGTGVRFCGMG